jgi:very-short-patch-repair endonuclease
VAPTPDITKVDVDFADEIRRRSQRHPTDAEIAKRAHAQHGVITLAQLGALGLGPRGSEHRAATGRLHRLHRGVYSVESPGPHGRWLAAVLACGEGAVLSHKSAADLWGLVADAGADVHVNVVTAGRRRRPGIALHRSTLSEEDVTTRDGIPCTTLSRTLVDVAAMLSRHRLERAISIADEQGEFDLAAVREQLDRMRGQRGSAALGAVLARFDDSQPTRSVAETRFVGLVRRARLPSPEVNAWIPLAEGGGYRPDFLWRDQRLIVEVDGRSHHSHRRAFAHDRRRDRRLLREGYATVRFPAREVIGSPAAVASELRSLLEPDS